MPACLPAPLVAAAKDADEGLAALHGRAGTAVFPDDACVGALVDMSGKKWAHTAVVTLPFPDVEAITGFVEEQLQQEKVGAEEEEGGQGDGSETGGGSSSGSGDGRASQEERARNVFAPALLFLPAFHPLAPAALAAAKGSSSGGSGSGNGGGSGLAMTGQDPDAWGQEEEAKEAAAILIAAGAAGAEGVAPGSFTVEVAEGGSILSLLLRQQAPAAAGGGGSTSGSCRDAELQAVLCLPLDLAGQDTPPFSAGLLPGAPGGDGVRWESVSDSRQVFPGPFASGHCWTVDAACHVLCH